MNAKVVLNGLVLGESPRWHGRLWVADRAAVQVTVPSASAATER